MRSRIKNDFFEADNSCFGRTRGLFRQPLFVLRRCEGDKNEGLCKKVIIFTPEAIQKTYKSYLYPADIKCKGSDYPRAFPFSRFPFLVDKLNGRTVLFSIPNYQFPISPASNSSASLRR